MWLRRDVWFQSDKLAGYALAYVGLEKCIWRSGKETLGALLGQSIYIRSSLGCTLVLFSVGAQEETAPTCSKDNNCLSCKRALFLASVCLSHVWRYGLAGSGSVHALSAIRWTKALIGGG